MTTETNERREQLLALRAELEGAIRHLHRDVEGGEEMTAAYADQHPADHATDLVDREMEETLGESTDQLVRACVREAFADCTVVTVAHRLDTVLDSDRVMVFHAGTQAVGEGAGATARPWRARSRNWTSDAGSSEATPAPSGPGCGGHPHRFRGSDAACHPAARW